MPKQGEIGGSLTKGRLKLTFVWQGDRFQHRVEQAEAFLESTSDSDTFDTPVFQEVHQQGDLLFASGMSGGRHWSASIEPAADGFAFDVACRVKSAETPAASCYEGGEGRGFKLEPISLDEGTPTVETAAGLTTILSGEAIATEAPYTIRYRYRITRPI